MFFLIHVKIVVEEEWRFKGPIWTIKVTLTFHRYWIRDYETRKFSSRTFLHTAVWRQCVNILGLCYSVSIFFSSYLYFLLTVTLRWIIFMEQSPLSKVTYTKCIDKVELKIKEMHSSTVVWWSEWRNNLYLPGTLQSSHISAPRHEEQKIDMLKRYVNKKET